MTPARVSKCLHVCVFITILPTIISFDIEDLNSNFPAQYGEGSGDDLSGMLPPDDEDGISDDLEYDLYDWDPISDGGEGFDTSGTSLPPFPAPPKTPSQEMGMQCDDGMWIGHGKICNGHADCYDCSDEEDCPYANDNVFMCYGEGENSPTLYNHSNPKCIPLARFCDGRVDCNTGADERQIVVGFRCPVVNRRRQCILPQRYVCDDTVHCEDRSDICPEPWMEKHYRYYGTSGILASYRSSAREIPAGFFQCLDGKLLISQKQLCDGTLDCADLSDECLCDAQRSNFVGNICKGLCAEPVWPDQPPNANCNHCKHGEIYWKFPVILAGAKGSIYGKEGMCYSPQEIVLEVESMQAAAKSVDSNIEATQYEIMEFFDANMRPVRARKCDGRPEFVDGSDECGIGCNEYQSGSGSGMGSGDLKGKGGDPEFCKLLTGDSETFACLSDSIDDGLAKTSGDEMQLLDSKSIVVCDGEEDCADGSDEMFCPKRIPCYANITTPSFDVSQRCDGYSHCPNGKDEDPHDCLSIPQESLLCQEGTKFKTNNTVFTRQELIDGVSQCETGSDEAPPYFTEITQVKDEVYGIRRESSQIGISSQDAAIAGVPLQVFYIAISFLGAFALAVSLALGFYNITFRWHYLCKSGSEIEFRDYVVYVREIIINIGVTIAKGLVCGYFAYVIITRREESNYAGIDLKWRSSKSCSISGTVALLGCQLPVLSLAVFAVASMIFDCVRRASHKKDVISTTRNLRVEEAFPRRKVVNIRKRVVNHIVMVLCCIVLIAMIYWPIVVVVTLLHTPSNLYFNTATYGWVVPRGAPQLFRANLLNQDAAKEFVSKAAALSPDNPSNLSGSVEFSFDYFSTVANSVSENFKMETLGSFGYFSQSGSCLPAFLVHATGGEAPYDIAVSNRSTVILSAIIVAFNFVIIFFTGAVTTRYGSGVAKTCSQPSRNERLKILDRTFSRLVIIEMGTWVIITLAFLLKSVVPDIATDRTYATLAIVVLGLNCGVATPAVMLLRKFRVRNSSTSKLTTCSKKSRKRQNSNDSRRIIEASDTSQEREHFTEEDKSRDSEPSEQPDESDSLVQHADDVEQLSTTKQ